MIYKKDGVFEVLHEEDIDGYKIIIASLGTHPVAYIGLPKDHVLNNIGYFELSNQEYYGSVNGGFTYGGHGVNKLYEEVWFLGWDYAHFGDYYCHSLMSNKASTDKKWTTKEIYKECIKELNNLKNMVIEKREIKVFALKGNNHD